jgi:hypothetical protein
LIQAPQLVFFIININFKIPLAYFFGHFTDRMKPFAAQSCKIVLYKGFGMVLDVTNFAFGVYEF